MEEAVRLVEICCLGYVRRDDRIVSVNFGDTIDLDGEHYRYAFLVQAACQSNGRRAAPAMPVNDDSASALLGGGRRPIMVRAQQAQCLPQGFRFVVTLEDFHINAGGVFLTQAGRQLYLAVDEIIMLDESPDEADYDHRGRRSAHVGHRLREVRSGKPTNEAKSKQQSANRKTEPARKCGLADTQRAVPASSS